MRDAKPTELQLSTNNVKKVWGSAQEVVEDKKPKEEDHYTGSSNIANKAVPQKPIPAQN